MTDLPDAPPLPWHDDGAPILGTFRGECGALPFDLRFGRLERVRSQKRWLWCGVMAPDVAVGLAIVRTGYAANIFCWVFDRQSREFLQDTTRVMPVVSGVVANTPPQRGLVGRYRGVLEGFKVERDGAEWRIEGTIDDAHLDVKIVEIGPPSTAICPVPGSVDGYINVTRKHAQATAQGVVRVGDRRIPLGDASGFLDHSHGMLARETVWQWAIGAGQFDDGGEPVGFNLVASFNEGLENTIWVGGQPTAAGRVEFDVPDEPHGPWRVVNDRVDLVLEPEGVRAQNLDLSVVVSDYQQPLGVWRGTIDGRAVTAHGVAEFHRSVW